MDLISKKDLINRLIPKYRDGIPDEYDRGANDMLEEVIEAVEEFSAQNKWIPCSERLPDEGINVLCQCQANIFEVLKLTNDGWYHDVKHCYMKGFVIAWQPLPEPYKESEEQRV